MAKNNKKSIDDELKDLSKALAISTPCWFAHYASNGRFQYPKHLKLLDKTLVASTQRKITRLIINMPPRHGKSELISKYFPAWYLGINPSHRVILTSYEASFAASFGRKVRDLLNDYGPKLFNIELDPNSSATQRFDISGNDGGMSTAGAGGPLTGKGADLLIIDDPIKNDSEANSQTIRDNTWDWFTSTAFTRLEPNGIIILVMTRWHEDDLVGRILKTTKEQVDISSLQEYSHLPSSMWNEILKSNIHVSDLFSEDNVRINSFEEEDDNNLWVIINLPAIADNQDILGRSPGEVLWKERYPKNKLNEIKNIIGSYWFSSLYQQKPTPAGASIFKRKFFKYFISDNEHFILKNQPENKVYRKTDCTVYAVMDLAVTTKETSDYTAVVIFGVTPNKEILILDVIRERFEGADHLKLLEQVYDLHKPRIIGIESTQYQISLTQTAFRQGFPVKELKADTDKLSRALPIATKLESGIIYFKESAPWLEKFEDELLSFPNGRHDDQADAFAYINALIQPITLTIPASRELDRISRRSITRGF